MPKVSVIVPIYNAEKTLARCIDSILAQTFTDFELLLVNDGSKDSSGSICDLYAAKDSRIRVFHKENGGVSSARNLGLDNATGEWIAFADSDDYTYKNWLNNFIELTTHGEDLIVQAFYSDQSLRKEQQAEKNGLFYNGFQFNGPVKDGFDKLFDNNVVGYLWCKLFRHSIIKNYNLRFNTSFRFLEDEDFVFSYLTYCNSIISSYKTGYHYSVPNWDVKYSPQDSDFELFSTLIEKIKTFYGNAWNKILESYYYSLTISLFTTYESDNSKRLNNLRAYRKQASMYINFINIGRWFKFLIHIDSNCHITNFIISKYPKKLLIKSNA